MTFPVVEVLGPIIVSAFGVVGVLVQRGRRETSERFDRLAKQIADLLITVTHMDARMDKADVERAVLKNEVETIKDRHHLVDMLHRDSGKHRGRRTGLFWSLAYLLIYITTPGGNA